MVLTVGKRLQLTIQLLHLRLWLPVISNHTHKMPSFYFSLLHSVPSIQKTSNLLILKHSLGSMEFNEWDFTRHSAMHVLEVCTVLYQECPKCHVTIEKDGGCNHMVCKNQNCKADFCWVCLGPWEPHGSSWWATVLDVLLFTCCRDLYLKL